MPKRLKVLVIIFFAVALLGIGSVYTLNKYGYFSSSASGPMGPTATPDRCPGACTQTGKIKTKVINDTTGKEYNAVDVKVKTKDCSPVVSGNQPWPVPRPSATQGYTKICTTGNITDSNGNIIERGVCTGDVCVGSSGMTIFDVTGSKYVGQNCSFKVTPGTAVIWGPEGGGAGVDVIIHGKVVCNTQQ